jgi:glycosyltransferase involved in cell wall biosynthesis
LISTGLSFCMIVRDGEKTLSKCLASVAPLVDELIVLDTGSIDSSVEIARGFGATVRHVSWPGDFSEARNQCLERARMPWVLSLDADEYLEPVDSAEFRETLLADTKSAFVFKIRNYFYLNSWPNSLAPSRLGGRVDKNVVWMPSQTVRLFPRLPGVRYRYPVHESLIPSLTKMKINLRHCNWPIHHWTQPAAFANRNKKMILYRDLCAQKVKLFPHYFLGHLELGDALLEFREFDQAVFAFLSCLKLTPFCTIAYYGLTLSLLGAGRISEARRTVKHGLLRRVDRAYLTELIELRTQHLERDIALLHEELRWDMAYLPRFDRAHAPDARA